MRDSGDSFSRPLVNCFEFSFYFILVILRNAFSRVRSAFKNLFQTWLPRKWSGRGAVLGAEFLLELVTLFYCMLGLFALAVWRRGILIPWRLRPFLID